MTNNCLHNVSDVAILKIKTIVEFTRIPMCETIHIIIDSAIPYRNKRSHTYPNMLSP